MRECPICGDPFDDTRTVTGGAGESIRTGPMRYARVCVEAVDAGETTGSVVYLHDKVPIKLTGGR